ncbi:MAG TPA: hypothetical protein PKH92_02815 [Anaerolineaceae bacterium]|nr:hypothetical protein [Longilinea sp.]HNR46568.1 hypothetical protein [Anaerolineaceae bacterium]HNS36800.1 hypothetical protein [Anaerolineaceae bacterium]HNZ12652.1 hypothetical protein [Anaerolineaceae bacterium]HOD03955.1 hypothetical protein [Anaerolineaceae bacterium]
MSDPKTQRKYEAKAAGGALQLVPSQGEAAHRSRQRRAELLPGMQPAEQQDLIKRLIDFISTLETPDPR